MVSPVDGRCCNNTHLPDHGLVEEFRDFAEATAECDEPLVVSGRSPVGREYRRGCEEPAVFKVASDEVLGQELVHTRPSPVAREEPDVVAQVADSPVLRLDQENDGWTRAPFALAERRAGSCGEEEGWP